MVGQNIQGYRSYEFSHKHHIQVVQYTWRRGPSLERRRDHDGLWKSQSNPSTDEQSQ